MPYVIVKEPVDVDVAVVTAAVVAAVVPCMDIRKQEHTTTAEKWSFH